MWSTKWATKHGKVTYQKNTHQTQSKQNAHQTKYNGTPIKHNAMEENILKQWANDNGIVEYHTQCTRAKTWNKKQ
jgi:hypothetical protein